MLIATRLLSRDKKYFEIAKDVALSSDFKIQVGAIAVLQGKVIATSTSSNKTHPLQRKYNMYRDFVHEGLVFDKLHAEIGLISQLSRLNVNPKHISIYVYRVCKSREHGIARPCEGCMQALLDAGITHVYYSTDVGFAYEELNIQKERNEWGKRNARKSICRRCA